MGGRFAILTCLLVLIGATTSSAATNPQLANLQKTLRNNMVAAFKKEAPGMTITTVACKLPAGSGLTAHCKAHFKANGGSGYYNVTATLTGKNMKWTTTGHPICFTAKGTETSC